MLMAVALCGVLLVAVLKAVSADQRVQRRAAFARERAAPAAPAPAECPGALFRAAYHEKRCARQRRAARAGADADAAP